MILDNKYSITIKNQVSEIHRIVSLVDRVTLEWNLSSKLNRDLNLTIEELVSNVIFYGFEDGREHNININIIKQDKYLNITVADDGKYFNLLEVEETLDTTSPLDERQVGGLGIFLIKNLMDNIEYRRDGNQNIIELTKNV